jgi:hypothetical protein
VLSLLRRARGTVVICAALISLTLGDGAVGAVQRSRVGGVAAPCIGTCHLMVDSARFGQSRENGAPLGLSLQIRGHLDAPLIRVVLGIRRPDGRQAWSALVARDALPGEVEFNLPVYRFAQRTPSDKSFGLAPGTYDVIVDEFSQDGQGIQNLHGINLAAGREGLLDRAWVTRTKTGPAIPVRSTQADPMLSIVNRSPRVIWVHFSFLVTPRIGPLIVSWSDDRNRLVGRKTKRLKAGRVSTFMRMTDGSHLPYGRWRCVLRAGGIPVGFLRIQTLRGGG